MSSDHIIDNLALAYHQSAKDHLRLVEEWLQLRVESPIELMMGLLLATLDRNGKGFNFFFDDAGGAESPNFLDTLKVSPTRLAIVPQHTVGKYRSDFCVFYGTYTHRATFLVECDGHDFHERTKAQAARDKKRDRELTARGMPVFRFTGSEIYKADPDLLSPISEFMASKRRRLLEMA